MRACPLLLFAWRQRNMTPMNARKYSVVLAFAAFATLSAPGHAQTMGSPERYRANAAVFVATGFITVVAAQARPDFSGTWRCTSRNVGYPLVIKQSDKELTVESRSLPQGPPTETFRLDGELKTTVFDESGYWRRYDTTSHWDGDAFVGIAPAAVRCVET